MKRVASDPLISGLRSLSIDESGHNTPVSSPSSSRSGSPPGPLEKEKNILVQKVVCLENQKIYDLRNLENLKSLRRLKIQEEQKV